MRADSAGATHDLLDFCREHRLRYSVGYELSERVRAAILKVPEDFWIASLATDATPRPNRLAISKGQDGWLDYATRRGTQQKPGSRGETTTAPATGRPSGHRVESS